MRFFHASRDEFETGAVIRGRNVPSGFPEREEWLERSRPDGCLPRTQSIFMGVTPAEVKLWGPIIYEVEPIGDIERNDISCFEALVDLEYQDEWEVDEERYPEGGDAVAERMEKAVRDYWHGVERNGFWEYRAPAVRFLRRLDPVHELGLDDQAQSLSPAP